MFTKKIYGYVSLVIFILSLGGHAVYAANSPIDSLKHTSDQLIAQLQQNKKNIKSHPQVIQRLVSSIILPRVDQERMARSVVSKSAWDSASAAERQAFIHAFRTLVLNTYAAAFAEYTNETLEFKPLRGAAMGKDDLEIHSVIIRPGKPSIPLNYRVARAGDSWKIYDFSVEGVSMVQSFHSQLVGASQKGLPFVTQQLQQHNVHHS